MAPTQRSRPTVLWMQVGGLALVQGMIALTWVIYGLYLPQLLSQFGFPKEFAIQLLVVENLLAIALEPIMGAQSDQMQQWIGSRFPFIAVGVLLASGFFIAIPTVVVFGDGAAMHWVLVAVTIAWALAMTVFRSPALCLLGRYAVGTQLPQAASALTFMGALAGALGTLANQWVLSLGAIAAFAIGSFGLLAAIGVLRFVEHRSPVVLTPSPEATHRTISLAKLGLVFGAGVGITLGTIAMRSQINLAGSQFNPGLMLTVFTIAHLLTVIPAGRLASKLGNTRAMLLGVSIILIALVSLSLLGNPFVPGVVVLLGTAFSLIANGTIPFALSLAPPAQAGLGTGIYFGGAALAGSVFGMVTTRFGGLAPTFVAGMSLVAFLIAGGCVAIADTVYKT